ncbi:hypothetical protein AEAC466_13140 [Asticcacaulis sp. AC466]|uniref:hypothetical protein n=1 Tax=Asticcacaulis sp. AC466 TaxID=1282362 RepID=UPI0003C4107B|nr:hypothetical protein [Asticcacaulis sp. AC466]ESQ83614.1 hypothetical protein AEAC466_13140 [Asticcacaulis sp. AC466]
MKPRRPPLNLSEPRLKALSRKIEESSDKEDAIDTSAAPVDDILEAPLTTAAPVTDVATPEREPEPQPEMTPEPMPEASPKAAPVADTVVDTAQATGEDVVAELTLPPEPTPPVKFGAYNPKARDAVEGAEKKDHKAGKQVKKTEVKAEKIQTRRGMSPVLFWGLTAFISLLWACGLIAFSLGAQSGLTAMIYEPFKFVVLVCLGLFPAGLVFASAYALRNAAALSRQAQRTAELADAMLAPASAAASQTGELVDSLRAQVDHAVRAVRLAHADITELSARLKAETDRLHDAAGLARAATQSVTQSLQGEREALVSLSDSLGQQATGIIEAVDRQARMVADASDLAQAQLREAEASLAASTGAMVNAAADISDAAKTASEDLDRQTIRLETAGSGVSDQIRTVEESLSQQRAGLVSAALSLRADQEDFAVHIENQRAQLTEALSITRVATVDLGETSARGIDVLRDIVVSAQEHFRAINGAAENERTVFETRIHATLSNISMMAADARDDLVEETKRSLEQLNTAAMEAKRAADQAAQTSQMRVDRLNESIFEASKKADEVFDARFAAARRLIEESSDLIGEAGDKTAQKLDASFEHTRATIAEVNNALNELTSGAEQLPAIAQARLVEIRKSVEDGINAMMDAARRAAQETEAVDTAFQERVKRNYDMLTEAVRLMGVISGDQPLPPHAQPTTPPAPRYGERDRSAYARETPSPTPAPAPQTVSQPAPTPRLRLTPLNAQTSETRPSPGPITPPAPPPAKPARAPANEGWSWRDLLNGMEGREVPAPVAASAATIQPPSDPEFDSLDDLMVAEVNAMGVDATSLLSRTRIEETIGAIMAEDNEGARMVVRRVAPAAIRRLSRRLLSDAQLRQQANDFATFYDQQINMALMSKDATKALNEVLSTDSGRAYLLIDAAISDLI